MYAADFLSEMNSGIGEIGEAELEYYDYDDPYAHPTRAAQTDNPDVRRIAAKLRQAGYMAPDTGDQHDPDLMLVTRAYQQDVSPDAGPVDGLVGPKTEASLDRTLARMGGGDQPDVPPPLPAAPISPDGPSPSSPSSPGLPLSPASWLEDPAHKKYLLIGGAAAAGLLLVALLASKPKKQKNPRRARRTRHSRHNKAV